MSTSTPTTDFAYVGDELSLFARAVRWKRYYAAHLAPHIVGEVLEVGAGLGGTTAVLCDGRQTQWLCLEPDAALADRCRVAAEQGTFAITPEVITGTLDDVPPQRRFDTVLYIDVLEHIEDDQAEFSQAAARVRPGGKLIVLCPAHQFLFSPFDRAIGHFRRYDRGMFRALQSPGLEPLANFYLDSCGMLLSLANRLLLRSNYPTDAQVQLWDRCFVPMSRLLDPLFGWRLGKTVIGIWQRQREAPTRRTAP